MTRIVAISDLHGYLPNNLPEADILLIGGDVTPTHNHGTKFQDLWLKADFSDWLRAQKAEHIVGIGGNHDFALQRTKGLGASLPWTYLKDETVDIDGLAIHGSPWSVTFGGWAFMMDDSKLWNKWNLIPATADVLLVHGPMFMYGDKVGERYKIQGENPHVGSKSLRAWFEDGPHNISLLVCGHIHEGRGMWKAANDKITIANVSQMDEDYLPREIGYMEFDI